MKINKKTTAVISVFLAGIMLISEVLPTFASDIASGPGLAFGSDGKDHGAVYITKEAFDSLDADTQASYIEMCDSLADSNEEDVVFATDSSGKLYKSFFVPFESFYSDFAQDISENDISDNNFPEQTDDTELPDFTDEEEVPVPEEIVETDISEDIVEIEKDYVSCNMDLIVFEEEKVIEGDFEDIDDFSGIDNFYNTLISGFDSNYFKNQLSETPKTIYDAAKKALIDEGKNGFSYVGTINPATTDYYIGKALSALIITYPSKFNWMEKYNGGYKGVTSSADNGLFNISITIKESSLYSSTLQSKAKAKVSELVSNAFTYASTKDQNRFTYSVIEYFDEWICSNTVYYNDPDSGTNLEEFFYSHSPYGSLLKGYGACESYALAMTWLLDTAGITNIYATGTAKDAKGNRKAHAFVYVLMDDKNWYLLDSTWNDVDDSSSGNYLLCGNDNAHFPDGKQFSKCEPLTFPALATSSYEPGSEELEFSKPVLILKPEGTATLKLSDNSSQYNSFKKTWSSKNTKIAKVSTSGKVTAVAPGSTTITCVLGPDKDHSVKVECTVYVYQLTGNKENTTKKTSPVITYADPDGIIDGSEVDTYEITVGQKNKNLTAQELYENGIIKWPTISESSTNKKYATAKVIDIVDDKIIVEFYPKKVGTATISVNFGGKTTKFTYKVKLKLQEDWFDYSNLSSEMIYNGSAIKPKVLLSETAPTLKAGTDYKVTYSNNTNAGIATVKVTGLGIYAGTDKETPETFTISPTSIADCSFTCGASKSFTGNALAASTTVKWKKSKTKTVTLKAKKDYMVYYRQENEDEWTTIAPSLPGNYFVKVEGIGNFKDVISKDSEILEKPYTIKKASPGKLTLSAAGISSSGTVKYTGNPVNIKLKVLNNGKTLPRTSYNFGSAEETTTLYQVKYFAKTAEGYVECTDPGIPVEKGTYKVEVTVYDTGFTGQKVLSKSFKVK